MSNIKGNKFWWITEESKAMLERGYLLPGQSIEEKLQKICEYAGQILGRPDLVSEWFEMFANGWASLSSPIWANFGENRGLPISCFTSLVEDDVAHIFDTLHEVALMTKHGGGTACDFSKIRPVGSPVSGGGTASGVISFIEPFDSTIKNVSQAGVRRGGFAAYLDIEHPEIMDFLRIKDRDSNMQSINTAVKVGDAFMESMIAGDVNTRKVWAAVLQSRREKGIPYILFKDTVERNKPEVYKRKGKVINSSNLCNEIMLSTDADESLVCCLSSMNLYLYDEWKDTNAVQLLTYFLDAVMEDFINKSETMPGFKRAHKFAKSQRALGLGVLGFHSLLQRKGISFESLEASYLNHEIFRFLDQETLKASQQLAAWFGEPELMVGTGLRNSTRLAIAPTTSSASILGQTSPSIEPYKSNYYTVVLAKGSFMRKNKNLQKLLSAKGQDTREVWDSILYNQGSVQHLDFLTEQEKAVYKTFSEINPEVIIRLAAQRQKYIDQGQSLNLSIPNSVPVKQVNQWYIQAWKQGVKGLYYQRSNSVTKEALAKMLDCTSCGG